MLLDLDLVPQSCWFSNVRSEVTKQQWDKIRHEAYMEAVEYFEYNTEGAWMGDRTPIFVIMKDLLTPIEPIEETN